MARLGSVQLKQIQTALLDAYSSSEELAQMARLELGENLDVIAGGKNLRDQVFELVTWAERTERVNDLIKGALAYNPRNLALQELLQIASGSAPGKSIAPATPAQRGRSLTSYDIPFIGPVPFSAETADLFFGRATEIERLANRLSTRGVPLLILNGLSGSGKTSLLRAGLIPLLAKRGVRAIYVSILDSPHSDLLYALRRVIPNERERPGLDSIAALDQIMSEDVDDWLVLIIDQMERCFSSSQTNAEQNSFWRDIARLLRGDTVHPVKLILCVRSDWLHAFQTVSPFPVGIPVFNYLFLVEPLTEEQAREALIAPLRKFHVQFEPEVIDEIVADLSTPEGFVHPPQLQVVGNTLYEYLESRRNQQEELRLTRQDYEELQGASSILRQHLVKILKSLGPHESLGWQILLRLVGDDDIRISRHEDELRGNFDESVFQPVIESLVEYALIVRDVSTADSQHVYTLTHDYLVSEIKSRFAYDHRLQALRTSEHYLESGLADNQRAAARAAGFLPLEYERYRHIWRHKESLEWINPDATEYLALSALWHGDASFADWFSKLPADYREQTVARIQEISRQQVARGNDRPVRAIEQAAKQDLPPGVASYFVTILQRSFAAARNAMPAAGGATTADSAIDLDRTHSRDVFAGALWSMRQSLTASELATIMPALTQRWLRRNRAAVLSAVGGILLFAAVLSAAWYVQEQMAGTWVSLPPLRAGIVSSFVVAKGDNAAYFAATNRGRFRSQGSTVFQGDSSNQQWLPLGSTLVNEPIQALAVAQSGGDMNVYAAVRGRGVYRWQSQLGAWSLVNRGLNSYDIVDLAVDPDNPAAVYAAAINYSGVFESQDGGDTWFDTSGDALFGVSVTSLAFSHEGAGWVIAGTNDGRIFRKQRNASGWQPVAAFPGSGSISTLAWDSASGITLLAGTTTGKIYLSLDGGGEWVFLSQLPNIFTIASIAIMPGEPEKVFLVAYGVGGFTIWRSIDEVYTWELVENSNFSREFTRLAVGPPGSGQLFAYGAPGLFLTEDEGVSWRWVNNLESPLAAVRQIVVSPAQGGPTYMQLEGSVFVAQDLLNPSWIRGAGLPAVAVRDLVPDPINANTAYAGIYVPNRWSFYATRDAGKNWQATTPPTAIPERLVDDVTAVGLGRQGNQSIIYLGTASCGVIHSLDDGQTWETFGRSDCDVQNGPYAVNDIAVVTGSIDTVYVAADNAIVYRSTDRGRTWTASQLPISGRINSLAVDRRVDGRLYAIARGDGFWRSDDDGVTWRKFSAGLEDRSLISMAVTDAAGTLYVAATNGDVWVSSSGGEYWQSVRRNLPANDLTSIALTANDGTLVLSTVSEGSYLLRKGFALLGGDE